MVVPGPIIDCVVRGASRADWGPLLEAAQIAEYQPTMFTARCRVDGGSSRSLDQLRQPVVSPQRRSQLNLPTEVRR
jgi:hypothetical protein